MNIYIINMILNPKNNKTITMFIFAIYSQYFKLIALFVNVFSKKLLLKFVFHHIHQRGMVKEHF